MSSLSEKLISPQTSYGVAAMATLRQLTERWASRRIASPETPPREISIWSMDPEPERWVQVSRDQYRLERDVRDERVDRMAEALGIGVAAPEVRR